MKRRDFLGTAVAATAVAALPVRRRALASVLRETPFQEAPQAPPDVDAVTGDGREITIPGGDIADLAARLRGRLLLAGDDGYDEARLLLNPSFDKRPAIVVQPSGSADVQSAVRFAAEYELLTAVKCGGHSLSGKSSCDRGLQIDLSRFRSVRVDPGARKAWVTGGSLLGAVDHETMAHGLVTTCGTVSHTGTAGLTLGGGFGRLARRFGLAIDNLSGVDVVTADGELRTTSPTSEPDLFWGLRGGGGNFGVATSFEFDLHPMQRQVVGGVIFYPIEKAREALAVYADYGRTAPDELYFDFLMTAPAGGAPPMAGFSVCWSGPENRAERVLAPIRGLGTPMVDQLQAVDYVALQRSGDISDPRAQGSYFKGGFITELPDDLIRAMVENFEGHPARGTGLFFQHSGGAIGRVAQDATAFSHRDSLGNMMTAVDWPFGSDASEHIAWIREFWSHLEPFTTGFYVNDADPDATSSQIDANYRSNYDRLVELKNRYDPTNLFRLNTNIPPAA